jgi:hypothetical protein
MGNGVNTPDLREIKRRLERIMNDGSGIRDGAGGAGTRGRRAVYLLLRPTYSVMFDAFLARLALIALDFAHLAFETGAWFARLFNTFCPATHTILTRPRDTALQFEAVA